MSNRRHVLMYEPRFAALIRSGVKTCTIRRRRLGMPRPGDVLDHREWQGVPYRPGSRKVEIAQTICTSTRSIEIGRIRYAVYCDGGSIVLTHSQAEHIAKRDGFAGLDELIAYFERNYGLPFKGDLISWE